MTYFRSKHVAQFDRYALSYNKDTVTLRPTLILFISHAHQRDVTRKEDFHTSNMQLNVL
jgi:hypothetical protein